jgi:hypothetical protein
MLTRRKKEEHRHLNQFVIHAALDMVDDAMWNSKEMYLKVVDRFNGWLVSSYVTATGTRLMLLHDRMDENGIKNFFFETHELFIKTLLNPLYDVNSPITSPVFDAKVRALSKKHLNVA